MQGESGTFYAISGTFKKISWKIKFKEEKPARWLGGAQGAESSAVLFAEYERRLPEVVQAALILPLQQTFQLSLSVKK